MGSEVQLERYMPGYCSMRELGEDVSSSAWNYYDRQFQGTGEDLYSEYDKDGLKQKMLEHDAVFRRQVSELHRLYRTQRDLMDEMKRSELFNHHKPLSLNPLVYQRQDSGNLHARVFPSSNSACTSPSVLGAEHSFPNLSHLKRKTPKTDLLSAKDDDDSNDCEIIECRPGKVRRKMFDLQLSADEYIDPDELDQSSVVNARTHSFHVPSSCHNGLPFFGEKSTIASKGTGCPRSSHGMEDLNEPIEFEDDPPTLDFMNRRTSGKTLYNEPLSLQTPPKNYSRETSFSSRYGGSYADSRKVLLGDRENNGSQASSQLNLGDFNTNDSSLSQYLRPENSLEPSRLTHGRNGTSYGTSFTVLPNQSKDKFRKDRMTCSSKPAEGRHEPVLGPQIHRPSDVKCWPGPMASWEKYGCNSSQKQPHLISSVGFSKSSQASNQPSKIFGQKLNINSGYVVGIPRLSELDHGSSPVSKEESICHRSVKFENLGSSRDSVRASGCLGNLISLKYSKGLKDFDLNCFEGMDLNGEVTNDSHHKTALHQNLVVAGKMEQSKDATLLPWMKPKPFGSDTSRANKIVPNSSTDHSSERIHGFPRFAQSLTAGSFRLSKGHKSEMKQNVKVFDMNLPCETETNMEILAADEIADTKVTGFKNLFDLNSCLTEDETSAHSASSVVRHIDLEAPAPLDIEEDNTLVVMKQTQQEGELEHLVAEAMISFSSLKKSNILERVGCSSLNAATETLKWFAGVVSSHPSDSEQQINDMPQDKNEEPIRRTSSDEIDYFEHMTLKLTEMSAEEYMPKSAFPPIPNVEEEPINALVSTRPRRGQARRGRPKRDFQRDILPGIASLSRHEVTEDIQAFDGLMRAGGHSWQFGKRAAARNKPKRGRPRTVNVSPVPSQITVRSPSPPKQQSITCIGANMEERNLTSWGKTTRRPRRQRCPAGNLQSVRLN
ncbi:unnamed protein product [Rhodiola kirilowii]